MAWYADSKANQTPVISSRVRLARNVRKYPFGIKLNADGARAMMAEAKDALGQGSQDFTFVTLEDKSPVESRVYLERHLVSPAFLAQELPKGILVREDEGLSVLLNEEDHLRIQSVQPGDGLDEAWAQADQLDNRLEQSLEYAFHSEYGYLTSCPTNAGTGLRASFMIHLPMLERSGQMRNIFDVVSKFGMTIRGIYGEGTEPLGSIYQISNQVTMGKSEQDILTGLKNITGQIIEKENLLSAKFLEGYRRVLEDQVYRSYALLAHSRVMTAKEAMGLLSNVRWGYMTGVLREALPDRSLYRLMMDIQPASLQHSCGRELAEEERDRERADLLRGAFEVKP